MSRLFKYLKKYFLQILITLLLATIVVLSSLYLPILVGKIIDTLISYNVDFQRLLSLIIKMVVTIFITFISQYLLSYLNNRIGFNCCKTIRLDGFRKLLHLPISYIDNHLSGDITSRIINDVDTLSDGLILGLTNFFTSVLTIVISICYMFYLNYQVAFIVLFLTPLSLFITRFIANRSHKYFALQAGQKGKLSSYIDEIVNNQKLIISFNRQQQSQNDFDNISNSLAQTSKKAIFFSSLTNPSTRLINALTYAVIAVLGSLQVISSSITIGNLSTLLSYASQFSKPFNELSSVIVELQNALACANRIFELIDQDEIVEDAKKTLHPPIETIEFKGVYFSYNKNIPLIEDLSFKVNKGEKIAIVGPTGCGKTTLINLLMHFYDIDKGDILFNGISINDISRANLRENFSMVLQDSWLKQASIKDNLQMGKECSDQQMIEACKKCHIDSFIERLPQQYQTIINENDDSISQGQKQLLCIARTMIQNPDVLILDEATSSIDTRTELKVQQAFDELMKGKTAFIVAHRLSTIVNSDCILVMKDGNIIEKGNHQQLLNKKGFYYNLYNSQFQN